MALQQKVFTANDLWHMQSKPDHRYELIEGELIKMSPTGEEHGDIVSELNMLVRMFVKAHDLGRVTAAETGYVLWRNPDGKDTVLAPDVGFIAKHRMSPTPNRRFVEGAPDLAIEVLSPSDKPKTMEMKARLYLKYGARLVWNFNLKTKTVTQHRPGLDTPAVFGVGDVLDGGDVLPGFTLALNEIFGKL